MISDGPGGSSTFFVTIRSLRLVSVTAAMLRSRPASIELDALSRLVIEPWARPWASRLPPMRMSLLA